MIYSQHPTSRGSNHSFADLALVVRDTVEDLRPHRREFDFIVVTGVSGITVGSPVALRLHKPLVVVRKPYERRHDGERVIGKPEGRGLFLDDFTSSGRTYENVANVIRVTTRLRASVVAVYEYKYRKWTEDT